MNIFNIYHYYYYRYADQYIRNNKENIKPKSRVRKWKAVDRPEMWMFLGLLILQCLVGKPKQEWYWSTNDKIKTPFFGEVFTEQRYSLIMKFLHFTNNETFDPDTHPAPKLYKIWKIREQILKNFRSVYIPSRDISIDESLLLYKGRLGWKVYIPLKRAKIGLKSYVLSESTTGYIWNSFLYTGKGTQMPDEWSQYGLATASVMTLLQPLLGQGYCVIMDNFYNSPQLFDLLVQHQTDAYGTLRPNRRNLPIDYKNMKLIMGAVKAWQRGKMMVLKWKDKKDVHMISTVHSAGTSSVKVKWNDNSVIKPTAVLDYNKLMGGVDRSDQGISYYPITRKQQKKYYLKIFRNLLEQCLFNSYVLVKKYSTLKLDHAEFLLEVVERIVQKYMVHVNRPQPVHSILHNNHSRLTGRHFPERKSPKSMCVVCYQVRKRDGINPRKQTIGYCSTCKRGLCPIPCFKIYHTELNY